MDVESSARGGLAAISVTTFERGSDKSEVRSQKLEVSENLTVSKMDSLFEQHYTEVKNLVNSKFEEFSTEKKGLAWWQTVAVWGFVVLAVVNILQVWFWVRKRYKIFTS
jgi:hypothetical protein